MQGGIGKRNTRENEQENGKRKREKKRGNKNKEDEIIAKKMHKKERRPEKAEFGDVMPSFQLKNTNPLLNRQDIQLEI